MSSTKTILNSLPEKDITLIKDVITYYGYAAPLPELQKILRHIFLTEIKPEHFICLGILIGESRAAVKMQSEILNTLTLCQRQN